MTDTPICATRTSQRALRATAALLMGSVVVGCTAPGAGPGVSRYEPTYLRLTEERAFAQGLRRHYLDLATNAFDRSDIARSDFYSLRALMAAEGKLANPGQAASHVDIGGEAATAGNRLSAALRSGARTGSPEMAARAQAAYDCWLVEMGPDGDAAIAQSCRFNTMNALADLEGASVGAQRPIATAHTGSHGRTIVVEPGMPSQVMSAHGVTIEVIQHTAVPQPAAHTVVQQQYVQQPQQVAYVQQPQQVAYVQQFAQPATRRVARTAMAPMPAKATPMIRSETVAVPAFEVATPAAPATFVQPAPVMVEEAGTPMNIIPPAMQAVMIEEPMINFGTDATEFVATTEIAALPQQSIDLGPIPVFESAPIETMPMVEMAALPNFADDGAATALIDANASLNGDYAVFFGFDSDDVTLEAEDVLIDTVEQIKLGGMSKVTLIGFTDSMGNARYNQLLAMRRAQAVRQYLQKALGNSVAFEILPVGEVEAVKNGGDGIKEALNRKVEVRLSN